MYYFNAIEKLEEFKSYILSNLDNDISFGNMEYYYSLSKDEEYYRLKIWEVDLDEFGYPRVILKGCFGVEISNILAKWKEGK